MVTSGEAGADDRGSATLIDEQVRAEQVRTLFKQSTPVLLANVLNAAILSGALWWRVSHALLLGWMAAMTLMVVFRVRMRRQYWERDWSAPEHEAWGRRFTMGSACAGSLWGFAGGALLPDSLPHQVVVVFVIGGMAAGAAGTISCVMRAYYAYAIPALVPAVIRLASYGGQIHLAMMAMLALFVVALSVVARNVNQALVQSFRFREILSRSNELLERRVEERTAELAESQQRLAEIVRESPDGLVIFDEAGVIISANPAAEEISGRSERELVGKHFNAVGMMGAEDSAKAAERFDTLMRGERLAPHELSLVHPDGDIVDIEVNPRVVIGTDGQRRVHGVVRDVTERHRVERMKAEYEGRLRQAQRLESIGMLAGGVAHDFNNVLTMILNNVDSLAGSVHGAEANELLQEIRYGSVQAANLTKQLLAFSRKQLLDVKPASLTHVLRHARPMFERALGQQNTLSLSLSPEPAIVLVDATQLEQAIINLLVNARHAMPRGGHVDVDVRRLQFEKHPDWLDVPAGTYVRLSVVDNGTGMDGATQSRIFDPFFTTKELGHGTGLGLSTVYGIVNQAGGHIRVVSEPGTGSRFEILLPAHTPADGAVAIEVVEEGPVAAWTPGNETVLLVEDHPQVRRASQRILVTAGYRVLVAENGEQALGLASEHRDEIDVLVTDFIMPGLSGAELIHELQKRIPGLAVLLISGYTGNEITARAELGPDVLFLHKPFDAVSLTASTRAALDKVASTPKKPREAVTAE